MGNPAKPKPLSMAAIIKSNTMYDQTVEFPVTVGDREFMIIVYPYFSNTKIRSMLEDVKDFVNQAKEENLNIDLEAEFTDIIGYFIVRHFTNIKMTTSKRAKAICEEYRQMLNSDIFKLIIKAIPEESLQKVYYAIYEMQELYKTLETKLNALKQTYENQSQ